METFNNRLKLLIETLGYGSSRKFDMEIGVPESQTACVTGPKQTTPKIDYVQKIKLRFPQIDTDWLICGEGEMFRPDRKILQKEIDRLNGMVLEAQTIKQENRSLKFALSLAANSANYQNNTMAVNFNFVSSKKPVNQRVGVIIKFVADSIADRTCSISANA